MKLIITLKKEVADEAEGQALYEVVKNWLVDKPDVEASAYTTSNLETTPIPDGG